MGAHDVISTDAEAVHIRRLIPTDAQTYMDFRLAALGRSPTAFTSSPEDDHGKPVSWAAARIRDAARPDDFVLGAFAADRLVGIVGFERAGRVKARHKGALVGMAVAPAVAGRGVGGRLVARLLAEARAIPGLLQVLLTVSEGNAAAETLYAAQGFTVFGREPRALVVDGEAVAKLHMIHLLDAPPSPR